MITALIVIAIAAGVFYLIGRDISRTFKEEYKYHLKVLDERRGRPISVKDTLQLKNLHLPIIKIRIGEQRYNFLLDTGASANYLNTREGNQIVEDMNLQPVEFLDHYGMEGNKVKSLTYNLPLTYNKQIMEEDIVLTDLSATFDNLYEETTVMLHGVLGSPFFTKHRWELDFDRMVVWTK